MFKILLPFGFLLFYATMELSRFCIPKPFKIKSFPKKEDYERSLIHNECTICLDEFEENEQIMIINKCKHVFHKECIKKWLCKSEYCPNCFVNIFQ